MSGMSCIRYPLAVFCLGASSMVLAQSACLQAAQKSLLDAVPWQLQGGASRDGGVSYVSSVKPGDNVDVFVELNPLPMHVGKRAEVYLLVTSGLAADLASNSLAKPRQTFSMDAANQLAPSSGIDSWRPLATDMPLQPHQRLKVFSGRLDHENGFTLNMRYCLEGNLFYSRTPVRFVVDYSAAQVMQVDFPPVSNFAFSGATLNFRGGVESSVPYSNASVELSAAGLSTRVTPVVPGGRWQFTDVPVAPAMTLSLKVNGQVVDMRQYTISREPGWSDIEGFALDAASRLAYVVDAGSGQLYTVDLDSGAKKLLSTPPTTTALYPSGSPQDVALAPDTGKLFVTSSGSPLLGEFNVNGTAGSSDHVINVVRDNSPGFPVRLSGSDFQTIEYSQNRRTLYMADLMSGQIYAYDPQARNSRLLAQLPAVSILTSPSLPGGTLPIVGATDIALDEANDRLLAVSMFSSKVWAVNLTNGAVSEVFDQSKATVTGVPPRNLPAAIPYDAPANALISDGFVALAHDSKRGLWLLGKRQEVLGVNLAANTVTQVLDPVASPDNFIAELSDLGYDDIRDRYVYADGTLNALYSYDPVGKSVQRLSGKGLVSGSSGLRSPRMLAPAQNGKVVFGGTLPGSVSVLDFRNERWINRYLSSLLTRGLPISAPIGVDNEVRDFIPGGASLAYDPSRNRHILLSTSALQGLGMQGPPGNTPTLGIRGVPAGTGTVFIPAPGTSPSRIFSVDFIKDAFIVANPPYEELVPVYAGNSADLHNLLHVAVKGDGSQYMFANHAGELFAMNPATKAMTKLPSAPLPVFPAALAYVGDALLQLDMLGQLHAVTTDPRSADFGKRSLLSGTSRGSGPIFRFTGGMVGSMSNATVYLSSQEQQAIGEMEISSGNRRMVSGPQRGEGDALRSPGNITTLQDPRTLYVTDESGLIAVDIDTGDRITME